jgi:acyl carrier protein
MIKKDNNKKFLLKEINLIIKKYSKKISEKQINVPLLNNLIDSLDFVNLISLVEKKFKIKFKLKELDHKLTLKIILKKIQK